MKTATLPSVRVNPQLREAAESVLRDGETLSSLLEHSLEAEVHARRVQSEFIARGLRSREEARETGDYTSAEDVLAEIDAMLATKRSGS